MLNRVHRGHLRIGKCQAKAQMLWAGMSAGIKLANGPSENGVQFLEKLLKKMHGANQNFSSGLLNYATSLLEDGHLPASLDGMTTAVTSS